MVPLQGSGAVPADVHLGNLPKNKCPFFAADGRAQLNTSPDGDFAAMEQQHGYLVRTAP
jgi:hypothetical protein